MTWRVLGLKCPTLSSTRWWTLKTLSRVVLVGVDPFPFWNSHNMFHVSLIYRGAYDFSHGIVLELEKILRDFNSGNFVLFMLMRTGYKR